MTQPTSLAAYSDIKKTLGEKQRAVLEVLYEPLTNQELADKLHWQINCVCPRVKELRDRGLVTNAGLKRCIKTGKLAILWRQTSEAERNKKEEQLEFIR